MIMTRILEFVTHFAVCDTERLSSHQIIISSSIMIMAKVKQFDLVHEGIASVILHLFIDHRVLLKLIL